MPSSYGSASLGQYSINFDTDIEAGYSLQAYCGWIPGASQSDGSHMYFENDYQPTMKFTWDWSAGELAHVQVFQGWLGQTHDGVTMDIPLGDFVKSFSHYTTATNTDETKSFVHAYDGYTTEVVFLNGTMLRIVLKKQ